MTENQYKADKYLSRYSEALRDLEYYKERLDEQRAKAESVKSSLGFERGVDKYGESHPINNDGTFDPHTRERLLDVLIYQSIEYDNKVRETEQLALEIERIIDCLYDKRFQLVLKYFYIQGLSYEAIAVKMNYSYWHVRRLRWQGLETLGKNMTHNDPSR